MWINRIKINNFRNYKNLNIELNKKINIFYGENAQGKTNIIEAIYLSSIGKSFRTNKEKELIKFNEENCNVEINFEKSDRDGNISINIGNKKSIFVNKIKIKKLSELLGNVYVVLFSPENINIIKSEPAKRRKFLNIMISQIKPIYAHTLNQYNKVLEQRNNYLKQIKIEKKQKENLEIWDEQLYKYGEKIYKIRKEFIEKINKKIKDIHYNITKEKIEIKYRSDAEENYLEKIIKGREKDIIKGFTNIGIHRDDFEIFIDRKNVINYGSQGQQRTTVISLKLAEAEVIYEEKEERPIILLDDFMSELDETRIKGFIENIKNNQVIITGTKKVQIEGIDCSFFKIEKAKIN